MSITPPAESECVLAGCFCCYDSLDFSNIKFCCSSEGDCLCCAMKDCISAGDESLGVGMVTQEGKNKIWFLIVFHSHTFWYICFFVSLFSFYVSLFLSLFYLILYNFYIKKKVKSVHLHCHVAAVHSRAQPYAVHTAHTACAASV